MANAAISDLSASLDQQWHTKTAEETSRFFGVAAGGLSGPEVETRRERFGPNTLPQREAPSAAIVFLRQFRDPLIYLLVVAAVISILLGDFSDGVFIGVVLLANAALGAWQEWKAESGAAALEHVLEGTAEVRRDGRQQEVAREVLVPGDVVLLQSGDLVPADIRLTSSSDLRVDESLLTGESVPAEKDYRTVLDGDTPIGDRRNMVYAGTSVVNGRAEGVACLTGAHTEVGRIAKSLAEEQQKPPLVIRLERFTRAIALAVAGVVALLAVAQFLRGANLIDIFFLAVALAVSAIPEALPVAITVALSVSSSRMAARHVIVRRLHAVEGLGACTLIATDKTGTLTEGKLTLLRLFLPGQGEVGIGGGALGLEGELERDGAEVAREVADAVDRAALTGALCNEARLEIENGSVAPKGDPVDVAFLILAAKRGISRQDLLQQYPEAGRIPYESERKYSASFNRHDGAVVAHVKGALEIILPMCSQVNSEEMWNRHNELADRGFRIIAVASGAVSEEAAAGNESALENLELLGLAALIDPIREEAPGAVARCRSARVDVRMVTGDHPATAKAIAREVGISYNGGAVTGEEMAQAEKDEAAFAALVRSAKVYARVEPAQKTSIVKVLQDTGHFVAVTGDGVNDAPALNAAHIGVAMGRTGTDVARRAADLVLTDDNFASIVNGIEEGRIAYDNVRKVTWALISMGAAEVLLFLYAFATGMPVPLFAVQLLWLNVVTDGIQNIALAFERGEPGLLNRPPRPPDEPIFNRRMIEQTILAGGWMGTVGFLVFYWLIKQAGWPVADARNALLLLMVFFENLHVLNCRSETQSLFRMPVRTNPLLFISVIGAQALHIGAMYLPWLSDVLQIHPISVAQWAWLLTLAASLTGVVEIYKFFRRRTERTLSATA